MNSIEELIRNKYGTEDEELQNMFKQLPINIFFKDTEARYQLASTVCSMISGGDDSFSIIGKTDLEVQPDKALGKKFYEEDLEIIKNKKQISYMQEMQFPAGTFYYEIFKKPIYSITGELLGIVGVVTDYTAFINTYTQLREFTSKDALTGCYSRSFYESQKDRLREMEKPMAVIMADCNHLKKINDECGHKNGDVYIQSCSLNMQRIVPDNAKIFRIGGDEFVILVPKADEFYANILIMDLTAGGQDFHICGHHLSVSYGYDIIEDDSKTLEMALENADAMMYKNKKISHEKGKKK